MTVSYDGTTVPKHTVYVPLLRVHWVGSANGMVCLEGYTEVVNDFLQKTLIDLDNLAEQSTQACPGDMDGDGVVTVADVLNVLSEFSCRRSAPWTSTATARRTSRTCWRCCLPSAQPAIDPTKTPGKGPSDGAWCLGRLMEQDRFLTGQIVLWSRLSKPNPDSCAPFPVRNSSILTPMWAAMACLLLGLFAPVGAHQARAQQDPQSAPFPDSLALQPRFRGLEQRLNARSVSRLQWVGWGGAPQTQMITIDTPVFFEFRGSGPDACPRQHRRAHADLGDVQWGDAHSSDRPHPLVRGLSGGWRYQSFDFTNLEFVEDPSDEVYNEVYQEWSPNFGAGTFLTTQKSYFGVSVPNILMESLGDSTSISSYQRHFYAMAGHRQKVNVALSIQYNGLFKVTPNAPPALDLNMLAMWMDSFGLGATWRMASPWA